jgi:DNA primase
MIPSHIINEIRERAEVLPIVSEYVKMKKRGKNYIGLCPFHSERTPSFTVSPEKKLFHCFGCGEGGNVFAFIMKIENSSFVDAVKLLGEKLGINVPDPGGRQPAENKFGALYEIVKLASDYFQGNLRAEDRGSKGRDYLKKRGLDDKTAGAFKLGYSMDSWDALFKHLIQKGADPKNIVAAGLAISKEGGGQYDRFRDRLIFPICDYRGREVGFGGRVLGEGEPKYINSPETPIYNKSRILYGLNVSKDSIRRVNTAIIVEGNMDATSCHQHGISNVVASMGTALTEGQCKLLQRFCENVVLAYDTDIAGSAATERGVEVLKRAGFNVKVAQIDSGKDPDEMIRLKGVEAFKRTIESSVPWLQYKINAALSRYNLGEIEPRAKATREVSKLIAKEPDRLIRAEYIKHIAAMLKTNAETIAAEVKRETYYSKKSGGVDLRRITEKPTPKILKAEEAILRLAIENEDARQVLKKKVHWGEFSEGLTRAVAELLLGVDTEKEDDVVTFILENLPEEEAKKKLSAMMLSEHPVEDVERTITDYIATIKAHHLRKRITALRGDLEEAERAKDIESVKKLQREFAKCSGQLRGIEKSI